MTQFQLGKIGAVPTTQQDGKVIHKLTAAEKEQGSIFTNTSVSGMGPKQGGVEITSTYNNNNGDDYITDDELIKEEVKKYNQLHQLDTVTVSKDVDGDGKLDKAYVDVYYYYDDKTAAVTRHRDYDGDGFSDTYTHYEYDRARQLTSTTEEIELESIDSIQNREHEDFEIEVRKMDKLAGEEE